MKYLNTLQKTGQMGKFIFFHVKNDVGARKNNFFFDLKSLGVLPGVSDFIFLKEKGEVSFLEIKTSKGKLSDNQKDFIRKASELNHDMHVAYGWEQMVESVKAILS